MNDEIVGSGLVDATLPGAELWLRALATSVSIACVAHDPEGRVTLWSPAAERVFGWGAPEVLGRPSLLIPDDDQAGYRALSWRALRGEALAGIETRCRRNDGSLVDVSLSTVPLFDADGSLRGTMSVLVDITERKRAEAVLQQSEGTFRTCSDSIHEGFALHEIIENDRGEAVDYRTLDVNPAYAAMLGLTREQILGQVASVLYGTGEVPHLDLFAKVVANGQPARFETNFASTQKTVRITVCSTRSKRFATILEDITEYKRLEQQFQQAQKMEAIGHLASGIAHDFNNLLMVILGYSDMVMARVGDHPDVAASIQEIKNAGEQAGRLSRQVLAFSRKQQLIPRVLDLNQVVEELDKMLSRVIGDNIRLEKTFAPSLAHVKADSGQIEQILMNLAVNARDAMPKGGTLAITTANVVLSEVFARRHPGSAPGRYVSLTVRDTGSGMPPDVVARAFEPFFTTKGPAKGTGLGLSSVYRIVKENGGHITVESALGTGTTMTIYFPPVDAPVEAAKPEPLEGTKAPLLIEFSRMK